MGAGVKRSGSGRRHRPMGEINVTPFVDVMLVLLIVFMVTAPLLTVGVEVDLPKTQAGQINADAAPLVVSIKDDGTLYLAGNGNAARSIDPSASSHFQRQSGCAHLCPR